MAIKYTAFLYGGYTDNYNPIGRKLFTLVATWHGATWRRDHQGCQSSSSCSYIPLFSIRSNYTPRQVHSPAHTERSCVFLDHPPSRQHCVPPSLIPYAEASQDINVRQSERCLRVSGNPSIINLQCHRQELGISPYPYPYME